METLEEKEVLKMGDRREKERRGGGRVMPSIDQRNPDNRNDRRKAERRQCIFLDGRRSGKNRRAI